MPRHAPRPAPAGKPTKMSKNNPVAAYVYKNRLIAKRILASLTRALPASWGRMLRTMAEKAAFRLTPEYQGDTLPPIFHYWSENHVAPLLKRHGFASPEDFYLKRIEAERTLKRRELRILSIGSGACHLEIELVKKLRELGHNPHLECLDLNGALMRSAMQAAEAAGVADGMSFTAADANDLALPRTADVVIANQFLHHVENLEGLASWVAQTLAPDGVLLTSDVIGRNGHLLWPSVEAIVQAHWSKLPAEKRLDRFTNKTTTRYHAENHAAYSNEGIRAQDIVGVLLETLDFEVFLTYSAAIIPFVERRIGFNFDPTSAVDCGFIERIAQEDETHLRAGHYPAANMLAALRPKGAVTSETFDPVSPGQHASMIEREIRALG